MRLRYLANRSTSRVQSEKRSGMSKDVSRRKDASHLQQWRIRPTSQWAWSTALGNLYVGLPCRTWPMTHSMYYFWRFWVLFVEILHSHLPEGVQPYCEHFPLHRHFWPLNWLGNCLIWLANCESCWLFLISSSRIGVDMQRVEEVKVNMFIALPSDVDIGPSIPNSNCFENGTYYGVSILRK